MRLLIAGLIIFASAAQLKADCTQGESEDKVREVITAATDIHARNPAKAEAALNKIEQALDESLKPRQPTQDMQAATNKLCKDIDEILAGLRR